MSFCFSFERKRSGKHWCEFLDMRRNTLSEVLYQTFCIIHWQSCSILFVESQNTSKQCSCYEIRQAILLVFSRGVLSKVDFFESQMMSGLLFCLVAKQQTSKKSNLFVDCSLWQQEPLTISGYEEKVNGCRTRTEQSKHIFSNGAAG